MDLFDEKEHYEERAAIFEFEGGHDREHAERMAKEATKKALFDSEVISVVRMYHEKGGDHVKSFLLKVEKQRGSEAAQRLRSAALQKIKGEV